MPETYHLGVGGTQVLNGYPLSYSLAGLKGPPLNLRQLQLQTKKQIVP